MASGSTGAALCLQQTATVCQGFMASAINGERSRLEHWELVRLRPLAWLATRFTGCAAPTSTAPLTRFASGDCNRDVLRPEVILDQVEWLIYGLVLIGDAKEHDLEHVARSGRLAKESETNEPLFTPFRIATEQSNSLSITVT